MHRELTWGRRKYFWCLWFFLVFGIAAVIFAGEKESQPGQGEDANENGVVAERVDAFPPKDRSHHEGSTTQPKGQPVGSSSNRTQLVLPTGLPESPMEHDAVVQHRLAQALANPDETRETGDPILDGVIEAIRQRGSLVATHLPDTFSMQGPELSLSSEDQPRGDMDRENHHGSRAQGPKEGNRNHDVRNFQPDQGGIRPFQTQPLWGITNRPTGRSRGVDKYVLAEQLLRTARMLGKEERGADRRQLIQMLRDEAARCLNRHAEIPGQHRPHHVHGPQAHNLK